MDSVWPCCGKRTWAPDTNLPVLGLTNQMHNYATYTAYTFLYILTLNSEKSEGHYSILDSIRSCINSMRVKPLCKAFSTTCILKMFNGVKSVKSVWITLSHFEPNESCHCHPGLCLGHRGKNPLTLYPGQCILLLNDVSMSRPVQLKQPQIMLSKAC